MLKPIVTKLVISALLSLALAGLTPALAQPTALSPEQAQSSAAPDLVRAALTKSPALEASIAASLKQPKTNLVRARAVQPDLSLLRRAQIDTVSPDTPQTIRISFFDDAPLLVELFRAEPTPSGGRAYIGRVPGVPHSMAILVNNDGVVSMHVTALSRKFTLLGTPSTGYVASELTEPNLPDHSRLPPEYRFPSPKSASTGPILQAQNLDVAADTGATIDVMVMYTNTARANHGGTAQINAAIDAQVALTNQIYADSNVVQRLRLVYKGEVTHTELDSDTDLDRLISPGDGFLDSIPVLRDLYAADIVSLWGNYPDTCGLGSLMATESATFASLAYNVVNSPACTSGNAATFAHELGHNMGLLHDSYVSPGTTTVTPEAGGAAAVVGYAHGYIDLTNRFRTVMSYPDQCTAQMPAFNCTRILRFSNPALTYDNRGSYALAVVAPSGNAANAHERQALNDTRETTANFRQGLASFTGPGVLLFLPPSYTVAEGAGSVTLSVGRHLGSTGAVSVNYATANGTATAGSDYTAASGTLNWADGDTGVKTIVVNIAQDAILEGRETFTVSLSGATGGASIGTTGGTTNTATVSIIDDDPDTFPAGGVVPADYLQATPTAAWSVDFTDGYLSPTSLRSAQVYGPNQSTYTNSDLEYNGTFSAGNISFAYRVSSYSTSFGVLEFYVDNVLRFTSAGGETGWLTRSEAVTAGSHQLRWRFKNRLNFPCANANPAAPGGANCADRAWIDGVVLPLTGNTLSVLKGGAGTGTVTGTGINCGLDCTETVAPGTIITLTAAPAVDSSFAGWAGGGCSGTGICSVTLSASQNVTATFNLLPDAFPANCVTPVGWIKPAAATMGWTVATDRKRTGACSMKSDPIPNAVSAGANNATKSQIQVSGTYDAGNVSFYYNVSSETGYDCLRFLVDGSQRAEMGNCNGVGSNGGFGASGEISTWTNVSIPIAAGSHTFTWSYEKDDQVTGGSDAAWIDDVTLPPNAPVLLTVARAGTGAGTITGTGINCGADCSESVPGGTVVALTATPSVGSTFAGWSGGGCSGTGACNATVNTATTVTATFTLQQFNLGVSLAGAGAGSVASMPAGINCGATCNAAFDFGTMVTLTATPAMGSAFGGWSGSGCSGIGTCTINISAAASVTATFSINVTAPGAPTITAATPGNGQATISFTPPAGNGGSPITGYTVTCGGTVANGTLSPIVVSPLNNGMVYSCSVTASNVVGTSAPSASLMVTPTPGAALALNKVFSRKTHSATDYDIEIDLNQALGGLVTVEPRVIGAGHRLVFQFNNTVTLVGSSASTTGSVSHNINALNDREVIVTLTGGPDNRRATVSLTGVNGSVNAQASIGFLVGDVSNSRSVNAADISAVKARSGAMTNAGNFRFDLNASGAIDSGDVTAVKARAGLVLP